MQAIKHEHAFSKHSDVFELAADYGIQFGRDASLVKLNYYG